MTRKFGKLRLLSVHLGTRKLQGPNILPKDLLPMAENNSQPKQKKTWQEEFGIINRRPRTGVQHLKKLLKSAWPPEIELREDDANDRIEIVLRFPVSSLQLPNRLREIYFQRGMSLDRAFQEILRAKLRPNDLRTARAQLANDGYNAF